MSKHGAAARDWNSVVAAAPPPTQTKFGPGPQRPAMQVMTRAASSSAPAVPCRYTKGELLAMFQQTDRPPADFQVPQPFVASECQAPVTIEPPSGPEREILESGTWYMPNARPAPSPAAAMKPSRNSATRPSRSSSFARARSAHTDGTPPPSDYRPTRFNWRHDSHVPGNADTESTEHRRATFAEKPATRATAVGRSDAALSWRRDDSEGSSSVPTSLASAERNETETNQLPADPPAWRSPSIHSRRQSAPVVDAQKAEPTPIEEGLVEQMQRLAPVSRDTWWYQDPSGTVRGPFTSDQMRDWYHQEYFHLTLPVRSHPDQPFTLLGALFLQGDPAFLHHVPVVRAEPHLPPSMQILPQPYLQAPVVPQHHLTMFQPQPPPYYAHHAFSAPSVHHHDAMLRSSVPFASAPVVNQPVEPVPLVRHAPAPDTARQTPWTPFANVPESLGAVENMRFSDPVAAPVIESDPAVAFAHEPLRPVVEQCRVDSCHEEEDLSLEPEFITQSGEVPSSHLEAPAIDKESSESDESDAEEPARSVSVSAPPVPLSSSQSAESLTPASSAPSCGWASPPSASSIAKKSLLEIQREEEELHRTMHAALKAQQEIEREAQAQAQAEAALNTASPWGVTSTKPAPRSLLEIQKQEEVIQSSTKAVQKPVNSGWAAKVAPVSTSWGSAPKSAAVSMRQIQEEEQRVLCQQQMQVPQQKESAPQHSTSGWSAAVAGSAWPRPSSLQSSVQPKPALQPTQATTSQPARSRISQSESESDDDAPFWSDSKPNPPESGGSSHARNDFGGPILSPEFREWCQTQLAELSSDCDISLAEFLLTLESSEAIREYIYEYLGRSSKVEAFASGFLQLKEFDDSKLVFRSSRSHSSVTGKMVNNDFQDASKKKKNRRRRKKKSDYP